MIPHALERDSRQGCPNPEWTRRVVVTIAANTISGQFTESKIWIFGRGVIEVCVETCTCGNPLVEIVRMKCWHLKLWRWNRLPPRTGELILYRWRTVQKRASYYENQQQKSPVAHSSALHPYCCITDFIPLKAVGTFSDLIFWTEGPDGTSAATVWPCALRRWGRTGK